MDFVYLVTLDREFESPIIEDVFLHERDAVSMCDVLNKTRSKDEYYNYEKLTVRTSYEHNSD